MYVATKHERKHMTDKTKKNETTKVKGTITEEHTQEVKDIFGADVAAKLAACEGKTFLEILMNSDRI